MDTDAGRIVVTPNMNLSDKEIVPPVTERFGVPVALGNDVNMGTLGEKWLGAARAASSAVGIFWGTGIGGGVIVNGKLVRGAREGAGEIGHIVMQIGGPLCGCGNRGCLEALASRTAMERDIRQAIADGRESVATNLLGEEGDLMKSSVLKKALKADDPVVTEVMRRASEVLGHACLTVRHLLDPDVIVFGGGVIEACWRFALPIIRGIIRDDALDGARPGGYVARAELGDDAVVLGSVALARQASGEDPLAQIGEDLPEYPAITHIEFGEAVVGEKTYRKDIIIRGDGKVKKRKKKRVKRRHGTSHVIDPLELDRVVKGSPQTLFVGTGQSDTCSLTPEAEDYLHQRHITMHALPSAEAAEAYNRAPGRKAALIHLTC